VPINEIPSVPQYHLRRALEARPSSAQPRAQRAACASERRQRPGITLHTTK
jgi:hypothetical protein